MEGSPLPCSPTIPSFGRRVSLQPPGLGQCTVGPQRWAGIRPGPPTRWGSHQVLPKQPASAWAQVVGNSCGKSSIRCNSKDNSGDLRTPRTTHSAQVGISATTGSRLGSAGSYLLHILGRLRARGESRVSWPLGHTLQGPPCHPRTPHHQPPSPPLALTSGGSSLGSGRCRCSRSTSSISYTLISKGSFREPARGGGRSTHCPGRLGLRPRAAVSGIGAGISRLLCRPGTESRALDARRLGGPGPGPSPGPACPGPEREDSTGARSRNPQPLQATCHLDSHSSCPLQPPGWPSPKGSPQYPSQPG